ncbi:MAG: hypothetical protein ACYCUW_09680, partial [bacterium]
MSEDMEKAQILHQLKENFIVNPVTFKELFSQINDTEIANNYKRITRGLKVEDNYELIYSAMPWVRNINGLKQNQEKRHKEEYQVPDYSILIEDSQKNAYPVLVDVKLVKGDKQSCEIMQKQVITLQKYADDNKSPLLIAIYWEKFGLWTHNCIKNFSVNKKYKISIGEAFKNDLSHILGYATYIIGASFYRKSIFKATNDESVARHEIYGKIKKVFLSKDG